MEQTASEDFLKPLNLQQCCRNSHNLCALISRNVTALSPGAVLTQTHKHHAIYSSDFPPMPHFSVLTFCIFPFLSVLYLQ